MSEFDAESQDDVLWRAMHSQDLAQVLSIERNTQSVPWSRLAFEESLTRSEAKPAESNVSHYCQVLETTAEDLSPHVVGFYIVSTILDELHILNIAVAPSVQGQGLGHVLMNDIFRLASTHQAQSIFLEVRASNLVAQSLYEKWGFVRVSVRKNYYRSLEQEKEDAWVYQRQLTKTVSA